MDEKTKRAYEFVSNLESIVFDIGGAIQLNWDKAVQWDYDEANCDGWKCVAEKRPDIMYEVYIKALRFTADNKL